MTTATLTVPGVPVAKARPRFARIGGGIGTGKGFIKTYTPRKSAHYEATIRAAWHQQAPPDMRAQPATGPLSVTVEAVFAVPASWNNRRWADATGQPKPSKPDLDNLLKSALDGLNGLAWLDDAQVTTLSAMKRYARPDEREHLTITVAAIQPEATEQVSERPWTRDPGGSLGALF